MKADGDLCICDECGKEYKQGWGSYKYCPDCLRIINEKEHKETLEWFRRIHNIKDNQMYDKSRDELKALDNLQEKTIEQAIPKPKNRGPVFTKGEIVELKEIKFKVRSFGKSMIVLQTMPQNLDKTS